MDDRPKGVFVLVFILLGSAAVLAPLSPRSFGMVRMPSAELLDGFKPVPKPAAVSPSVLLPAPSLVAASAIVYDPLSDTVVFEKKSDQQFGIASITKVMTALVAYDRAGENDRVYVSRDAVHTEGVEGDLRVGEHFTLGDLATMMLVSSSNDAAVAIAEHIGVLYGAATFEESQIVFTRMMNEYARALGLTGTMFRNATGLDMGEDADVVSNVSTARDLALLMKQAFFHPSIGNAAAVTNMIVYSEEHIPHPISTTNELFGATPGVLGGKTGFTDAAGGALTTVAEVPFGKLSIVVVLGSTRAGRFNDTVALLEWLRAR